MKKSVAAVITALCLAFLFFSCKSRKQEPLQPPVIMELPCEITADAPVSDSLPMLPENLQTELYRYIKHVNGMPIALRAELPDSWQVEAALESPSSDYDIWLVSSFGEASYKMLLTLSVPEDDGTDRDLISALLVAYSYGKERAYRIESEEWYTQVETDYTLTICKKQESLHSLTDTASVTHANRSEEFKDVFRLNGLSGDFEYQEPEYTEVYRAVLQFMDTTVSGLSVDEAWVENAMAMQETLEPENIYFMEIFNNFNQVMVTNYLGELVDEADVSDFLKTYSRGYILLEKGKKPRYLRYCPAPEALGKILPVWGLNYTPAGAEDVENTEEW